MGYTHYFEQLKAPTEEEWNAFKKNVLISFENLRKSRETSHIIICDGLGENKIKDGNELFKDNSIPQPVGDGIEPSKPLPFYENEESLIFNGFQEKSHETFYLPSNRYEEFNFCKTQRHDYDFFVMVCLILADYHMPNCFEIGTDGMEGHWEPALTWLEAYSLIPENYSFSRSIFFE